VFSGEEPVAVIVDTTGTRLSVANLGGRQIESFNIAVNRKLQLIDTIALPGSATNLVELPVVDGLLAPLFDEQLISLTRYDEVENLLIDRSVQAVSGRASDLTLVATSRHVYTANLGAGDVQALAWNPLSNQLETNGPSIATGGKPSDLALSLDGSQLLVADQMDAAVLALSRDLQTGELDLPGANGPAGPLTRALAINPKDGGILAIANGGLTQFDLDNDGSLSSVASVAAGTTPEDLVISPDGRFAYVANRVSGDISAFAIGEGQLTELPASPYSDGGVSSTRSVALSPDGRLLAVSAGELDRIRIFEVDRATGELTFQQDCHVGDDPRDLTWSLNGRRLYVALYRDNAVAYADRKVDDQLILRGSLVAGEGPLGITLDPSGEQLFVAAYDSDTVEVLDIAPDGALTRSDSFPAGNGVGPAAIATLGVWNDVNP
ncbi:MAG: lactonase family protein, partial [Planctomycetota bacterium]